jgi:peptidoglycan/LPS O-acetylase OafA/YrhL
MKGRIGDIEFLRGIAVLMVVIHHANDNLFMWSSPALERFYTFFAGWSGVDLFFAISGFVIARDLVPRLQAAQGWHSTKSMVLSFWLRRAWRLLPSAWLWLLIMLVAAVLFNDSGVFGSVRSNLDATVAGVFQFANFRFAQSFMNWPYGASFVYWSLSLEEQFYLLFPLLILLSRRYLVYALIALVLAQLFLIRTPMLMVFRTDALALGVLVALWSRHPSFLRIRPTFLSNRIIGLLLLGAALTAMSLLGSSIFQDISIKVGLIALLAALLVWIASHDQDYLGLSGLLGRLLTWLGARSYGIYLLHIPVYFTIQEVWHRLQGPTPPDADYFYIFVLAAAVMIIVLCELNYRFIETPLRRRGKVIADRIQNQ